MKKMINKTLLIATITIAMAGSAMAQTDLTGLFGDYQNDDFFVNTTAGTNAITNSAGCLEDMFVIDSHYEIDALAPQVKLGDNLNTPPIEATLLPEPATVMMLSMGGLVFVRKK